MYVLKDGQVNRLEEMTFSEMHMLEGDIEEILRKNVDMICGEEESMLVVGQQVANQQHGRSDLIAIDQDGNLVLIEIKRDRRDIENRREAFEFQAIRYAASCATIRYRSDLVRNVFAPYVRQHREEFGYAELSADEVAQRALEDFETSNVFLEFNERQRIILVASDFDEQTLSAVAWLNSNCVDISCYRIVPSVLEGHLLLDMKKILPLARNEDYYVDIAERSWRESRGGAGGSRRVLPKIDALLEWGVVKAGDVLVAKNTEWEATLRADGQVQSIVGVSSLQQWLKNIYGWSSVQTYVFAIHKATGKSLSELREEYMENMQQ